MRHTILIATLSSVVASVLTTVVIGGSLFGADTASSANTPGEAITVQPGGVESILQGDVDCDSDVGTRDSQGILRYVLQQPALSQDEPCPDIATLIPSGEGVPGPQGEQGPAGPQGDEGPQGEQGSAGISDLVVVVESSTSGSGFNNAKVVFCPEDKKVLGGGARISGSFVGINIKTSHPLASGLGWEVEAYEMLSQDDDWAIQVRVICANVAE